MTLVTVTLCGCKTAGVNSNLKSSNPASDEAYDSVYGEVSSLQADVRSRYAQLQDSGLTSQRLFEEVANLAESIALQYPDQKDPGNAELSRSIFTQDISRLSLNSETSLQLKAFTDDLGRLEEFCTVWDRFLVKRASLLTIAHWRAISRIYNSLDDSRKKQFKKTMDTGTIQFAAVIKEMAEDEAGYSAWRDSYIGPRDGLPRKNRVQGARNAFEPYFATTGVLLKELGRDTGLSASIVQKIKNILATVTRYQPYVLGGVENANALHDFIKEVNNGTGDSIWDEFSRIFERFVASQKGTIKITGNSLPMVQGNQVVLPSNSMPRVTERGYKRSIPVDAVLFIGNHEHPESVTFAHTPLLKVMGFNHASVVTSAQNAFTAKDSPLPPAVGAKIAKAMSDSSDVFTVQQHGANYPGAVSESIEQFRQAWRVNKRLLFLWPQGDNPHGHGGESTRLLPTNSEFLPRLLSWFRETHEIQHFAVVPLGVSSMERLMYDPAHVSAGQTAPNEYRIEVGTALLDYEVELLMNLRYREMTPKNNPSAYTRLIQYYWIEESTRTFKNYPAGVVDISTMIQDVIVPRK